MSSLTSIEKRQIEDTFGMGGGFVLDFNNRDFAEAVREATGQNIDDERYCLEGTSKAKRLRTFWALEPDSCVGKLISSFVQYAEAFQLAPASKLEVCNRIAHRLNGQSRPVDILTEKHFLERDYPDVSFHRVPLEGTFVTVMEQRWIEAKACLQFGANLSVILLLGSMLEGLLLGAAQSNPREFNQSPSAPKDDGGKVLPFWRWNLAALIDAAYETGQLKLDVKKFSHALRDFRNYIHPYEQKASGFTPDGDTARVCLQVFRAAVNQLSQSRTHSTS
jgi:hypothetical protein